VLHVLFTLSLLIMVGRYPFQSEMKEEEEMLSPLVFDLGLGKNPIFNGGFGFVQSKKG
jgi:hypothetical protein